MNEQAFKFPKNTTPKKTKQHQTQKPINMKNKRTLKYLGLAAAALLLACATSPSQAQDINFMFPVGSNVGNFTMPGWIYWYSDPGGNTPMTCVNGFNAEGNNPLYGCLEMDCPFSGWEQNYCLFFGANDIGYAGSQTWNLLPYTNISFKVYVPAGIPDDGSGHFAPIQVYFSYGGGWNIQYLGTAYVPDAAQGNWVTVNCKIDQGTPNLSSAQGLCLAIVSWGNGNVNGYPTMHYTNYIDDITIQFDSTWVAPRPKLAAPVPAIVGLNETCNSSADSSDREQICTAKATGYSFVGRSSVTYSWEIKTWPDISTANQWQSHFFIVGGASSAADLTADGGPGLYDQAPDWNLANCIFVAVGQNTNGAGYINFRCKTNNPGGNGMIWNTETNVSINTNNWPVESLCFFGASTPVGRWSVNFQGSSVTITNPDGDSTNFVLNAGYAAMFADPVSLCLGAQANNADGAGQTVVYKSFSVTGTASSDFSDVFTADMALNTNYWRDLSGDPTGDNLVPPGSVCWVGWPLPDNGYNLQTSPDLSEPWQTPSGLTSLIVGTKRLTLIPSSVVGANQGYFRCIHRVFSQLQVLLPGESNDPNAESGKSGIPTVQASYAPFDVVVNACSSDWNIVNASGDEIDLSCAAEGPGFVVLNAPQDLSAGSATFSVLFQDDGTWVIHAVDATDGSKTPADSTGCVVEE